jgi:nucleoid-associated protein YgaU
MVTAMERTPGAKRTATLIAFEIGAVATLHALGRVEWLQIPWDRLGEWLQQTPADESLPALMRIVALALTYWIAASTALYALARITKIPRVLGSVEWATLPAVRRVVDGTAAMTVVAAAVAGPALPANATDEPDPIVIEIDEDGLPIPPFVGSEDTQPAETLPEGAARIGWTPAAAGISTSPNTATGAVVIAEPTRWTVTSGDNLWTIAQRHLGTLAASEAALPDLADYWRRVVAANQDVIRSNDPDLIYPGEIVVLPPAAEEQP